MKDKLHDENFKLRFTIGVLILVLLLTVAQLANLRSRQPREEEDPETFYFQKSVGDEWKMGLGGEEDTVCKFNVTTERVHGGEAWYEVTECQRGDDLIKIHEDANRSMEGDS